MKMFGRIFLLILQLFQLVLSTTIEQSPLGKMVKPDPRLLTVGSFPLNMTAQNELTAMRLQDNIHSRSVQTNIAKSMAGVGNLGVFIGGVLPYCRNQANKPGSLMSNGLFCHSLGVTGLLTVDYAIFSREPGPSLYEMTMDILNYPQIHYPTDRKGLNFTKVEESAASNGLQVSDFHSSESNINTIKFAIEGFNVFEHRVTNDAHVLRRTIERDYLGKALYGMVI